jgi:hypothetical protein
VVVAEVTSGLLVHPARDAARRGEALLDLHLFFFQFSVFLRRVCTREKLFKKC